MTSTQTIASVLRRGPYTVKQIASQANFSESRVREVIKTIEGVQFDTSVKPAIYWVPEVKAEPIKAKKETLLDTLHNVQRKLNAVKSTKRSLNPQYKINKKVNAVEEAGGSLTYDRTTLLWTLTTKSGSTYPMSALEFSQETSESLVAFK